MTLAPPDAAATADRLAITELLYRYCRAVDRLDVPLGRSIWHADGWADYGADVYQGPGRGVIDHICSVHRRTLGHSHQVTNILITLDDDRAASEAYHFAALRVPAEDEMRQISVWGRYVDRWSRRGGRWGLDHRIAIRDFDEVRPVTPLSNSSLSRRDRQDPSYAALEANLASGKSS